MVAGVRLQREHSLYLLFRQDALAERVLCPFETQRRARVDRDIPEPVRLGKQGFDRAQDARLRRRGKLPEAIGEGLEIAERHRANGPTNEVEEARNGCTVDPLGPGRSAMQPQRDHLLIVGGLLGNDGGSHTVS